MPCQWSMRGPLPETCDKGHNLVEVGTIVRYDKETSRKTGKTVFYTYRECLGCRRLRSAKTNAKRYVVKPKEPNVVSHES